MHYLLWLGISHLYIQVEQKRSETPTAPMVITDQRGGEKRVLDCCAACQAKGVYPGLTVAEAKSILGPEATYLPWREEPYRNAQTAWLEVCARFTDVIEPETQHSAYLDLSAHPDPRSLLYDLKVALKQAGFESQVGAANCRWVAKLSGQGRDEDEIALRMPRRFVAPLPVELLPIAPEHCQRLRYLGYASVGELAALSIEVLRAQFGDTAFDIQRAAMGGGDAKVQSLYPPDRVASRYTYESPPVEREVVERGVKALAAQLGERLSSRDKAGKRLLLTYEFEEGEPTTIERTFTKPICDAKTAGVALALMTAEWPEPLVTGLRAVLPNLAPLKRIQRGLDDQKNDEKQEAVTQALASVRRVFGDLSVRCGLTEPPRTQFLRAFKDAVGWH